MRAPFQILVFPFLKLESNAIQYCIFQRRDSGVWQGIAGGGEGSESPIEAAKRESWEEAGIPVTNQYTLLRSRAQIPVQSIGNYDWGKDVLSVPEYAFGVELVSSNISLSDEHTAFAWLTLNEVDQKLTWASNRAALHELDCLLIS